jgi:hypothetical protein
MEMEQSICIIHDLPLCLTCPDVLSLVGGTMDAEINNIVYMELCSGPKMAHGKYEKTNVARFHCIWTYVWQR